MPETISSEYAAAEREAYRGVRRACDAGLDSLTLRAEVTRRITRLIPAEASSFGTLDPHTGLLADLMGEGAFAEVERLFLEVVYPIADAERTIDLARSGQVATTESSDEMAGLMRGAGFGRELRAAFALGDEPAGMWLALREARSRAFGEHDVSFIHRIAPHVARALRRATLVDAAQVARLEDREQDEAASAQLADLADASRATAAPTSALIDLVERQRAAGGAQGVSYLSLQGRSGRWYTLRAALTEPDELGRSSTVLIITPAGRRPIAPGLTRRYGLSPRERDAVSLAVRGFATAEIARQLGLSTSAVREHLAHAAEKIGARGRSATLATLHPDRTVSRRVD
jgi:DNA-binding CsgD family transcriptional regulator